MKFSRWMHTLTLGVKQLKIKTKIFWQSSVILTDLSFRSHVKAVVKLAYFHLKIIARIRFLVSSQDLEKLVHAFIISMVDYCNCLLSGLPKKTIWQLQLIQNAAVRILTRTRKSDHITPVLRSLHWLPVTFRIDFKVLLLVNKLPNGLGPKYIADMLTEYKPYRPLRSLGSSLLCYYAAHSWKQLPEEITCTKTLAIFKSRLKTHLFSRAFVEWAVCYVFPCLYEGRRGALTLLQLAYLGPIQRTVVRSQGLGASAPRPVGASGQLG